MDWDNLRFLKAIDSADTKGSEQEFVSLLIHSFESALKDLDASKPEKQINTISKYIGTYYKLKKTTLR
ncbi:hypothetical protein [Abyssogena phaseoliformis symbiont]|uniref:hypothetical protein n=1 Tax=Abyssogena phaseoliformis symbiont TaxID=596095 RepID=UPI0019154C37|nr:hypothetical protein [Abyssogena phaseoliformis symbiont]